MGGALSIVGLGTSVAPADLSDINRGGGKRFFRDRFHPSGRETFESGQLTLADAIAAGDNVTHSLDQFCETILSAAETDQATYFVPGNPFDADASVRRLYDLAQGRRISIAVTAAPGISSLMSAVETDDLSAGLQLVDGLDIITASELDPFDGGRFPISPLRPVLIMASIGAPILLNALGRLLQYYSPDADIVVLQESGVTRTGLFGFFAGSEIDWIDQVEAIFIPAQEPFDFPTTSESVEQMASRLRAPNGCPWDREQSHKSLISALIEEAYEVIDAIDRADIEDLKEELGDLLFQVHIHSQIAREAGEFGFEDIASGIVTKLYRRHPHVFGERSLDTAGQVVSQWDDIKRGERETQGSDRRYPLGKVPRALPSLSRCQALIRRAERAGLKISTHDEALRALSSVYRGEVDRLAPALIALCWLAEESGVEAEELLREQGDLIEARARRELGHEPADGSN